LFFIVVVVVVAVVVVVVVVAIGLATVAALAFAIGATVGIKDGDIAGLTHVMGVVFQPLNVVWVRR